MVWGFLEGHRARFSINVEKRFVLGVAQPVCDNHIIALDVDCVRRVYNVGAGAALSGVKLHLKTQHCCQIQRAVPVGRLAINDIGFASIIAVGISLWRPDDQVIISIVIDIPCTGYRISAFVVSIDAVDDKAVAAIKTGQLNLSTKGIYQEAIFIMGSFAEHDIGFAGIVVIGTRIRRPDDQIINAVTVDIACTGY